MNKPPTTPQSTTTLRLWAPKANTVEAVVDGQQLPLHKESESAQEDSGWWVLDTPVTDGQRYGFSIDGSQLYPDPRSRHQPDGVHGLSEVYIPRIPRPWPGMELRGAVIYELHIASFTRQGTFAAAIEHLDDLVELGVQAVEVMPVAQVPGERGWGYDGVDLFATQHSFGGPAGFQDFIDAAHDRGLGVILDVVYNHLGPEGNYLSQFGPYFNSAHHTPWGDAVNLDGSDSRQVRDFLIDNAHQWLVDYGIDGLRLDAVHALADDSPTHFLAELSTTVQRWSDELGRPLALIAESDLNQPDMVTAVGHAPQARGMTMQWDDDIHHALHAFFTGEHDGYYCDFGSAETLVKVFTQVFEHDGGWSTFRDSNWGAPVDLASGRYDGHSFVGFIQDHDQVGNRAAGDRLGQRGQNPGLQAASAALYLLSPFTPMIFMGEEWAASTPFPFFSDLGPELGPLVSEGRRREFAGMDWADEVPDPQDTATFESSRLDWDERTRGVHAQMLEWYKSLIQLRRAYAELSDPRLPSQISAPDSDSIEMKRGQFTIRVTRSATDGPWASVEGDGHRLVWE